MSDTQLAAALCDLLFEKRRHAWSVKTAQTGAGGCTRHGFHLTAAAIVVICCSLLFPPHSGIISRSSYSNWTRAQSAECYGD
jgi:hypothetical protein